MDLLRFYQQTLRIRLIEEAIAERYSEQQMRCPTHLSIGQELVPVVVSSYLTSVDKVYSTHRAHAHYLAKGGDLNKLIAELYGKQSGCTGGRGGSMHLSDLEAGFIASTAIVANSIPLAVGTALNQKLQNINALTVSYFGDGATEEGAFYESANFAVVRGLPVLFACENNKYSVYSPLSVRQPHDRKIYLLAEQIGMKSYWVDGSCAHDVDQTCKDAIEYIRRTGKPAFVEFETYRYREHCGPNFDDELGYRPEQEVEHYASRDPLILLEKVLSERDDFESIKQKYLQEINIEIKNAFELAIADEFADVELNSQFLYAK